MNDTNQIIHEQLFQKCWHEFAEDVDFGKCLKCDKPEAEAYAEGEVPPNWRYDSDLNKTFAAQAKAIERFGYGNYWKSLLEVKGWISPRKILPVHIPDLLEADAEQRCAAIVKLLENKK